MRRYLVSKSNNTVVQEVTDDYVLDLLDEPYYYIVEWDRAISNSDYNHSKWNGSKIVLDTTGKQREMDWAKANKWFLQKLENKSWDSLSQVERKFILQKAGAILTVDDINALIAIWAKAGSPIV